MTAALPVPVAEPSDCRHAPECNRLSVTVATNGFTGITGHHRATESPLRG